MHKLGLHILNPSSSIVHSKAMCEIGVLLFKHLRNILSAIYLLAVRLSHHGKVDDCAHRRSQISKQQRLGASFFFPRGGADVSHAGKFFTSIAVQLAYNVPSLRQYISEVQYEGLHAGAGAGGLGGMPAGRERRRDVTSMDSS
jgi:hypothetical protein